MSDPLLLTPGPLTTAPATRAAMIRDLGSRSTAFIALTAELRARLVALATHAPGWTAVPIQGSGTFAVEAALTTLIPGQGRVLVLENGAYGKRILEILHRHRRHAEALSFPEEEAVDPDRVEALLVERPDLDHVVMVWCETTTGIENPLARVAQVVARQGRRLLVDGMSAFGALPVQLDTLPAMALIASSNKCLEGVPGLGFVICPEAELAQAEGRCPSLSLDLAAQWARLRQDGQWRFTPPVQVVAALVAALRAHEAEGGVEGRGARYRENCRVLVEGMRALGFRTLLPDAVQAPIIVTFHAPTHPRWSFEAFYEALLEGGFAIYPGKLTERPSFRVGCIGAVQPADLRRFVALVGAVLERLGIEPGAVS